MKTLAAGALVSLALSLAPSNASAAAIEGRWILDFDREAGRAQLTMKRSDTSHGSWTNSHGVALADFQGLARPSGTGEVPAHFTLVRDAGTVTFDGRLDAAGGSGRFTFTPAPGFAAAMAREGGGPLSDEQVFSAAIHDVSRQLVSELAALGYDHLSFDRLLSMRIHGAGPEFIRELKALGYEGLSPDSLVSMRIHGATPEFIRELKALGYERLSADSLVSMRIHGVSPEYIRGLKDLGYRDLSVDQLVSMRIHGVTLDFVKRMLAANPEVSADDLVSARIHGRRGD